MNTLDQSTARHLETTFRPVLAAAFAPDVSAGRLRLSVSNDEIPEQTDKLKLPALVLLASVTDWNLRVKVAGRYAEDCELKIQCRVAANAKGSGRQVEELAAAVRAAVEKPMSVTGWLHLYIENAGRSDGFEKGARVIEIVYKVTALPAP